MSRAVLTGGSAAEDHHSSHTLTSLLLIDRPSGRKPWDSLAGSEGLCIFIKALIKKIVLFFRRCPAGKGGGAARAARAEVDVKVCL